MRKIIRIIQYYYDYYVGCFFYDHKDYTKDPWHIYIVYKYPERFQKEIEYLKNKSEKVL